MKPHDTGLVAAGKLIAAMVVSYWTGFPIAIQLLLAFMGLDIVTGAIAACLEGKLSSSAGFRGLLKKAAMLVSVLFIHLLDGKMLPQIGFSELGLEKIFALYLVFNESISVLENLARTGVPFPLPLVQALAKAKTIVPRTATQAEIDALSTTVKTEAQIERTSPDGTVTKKTEKTEVVMPPKLSAPPSVDPPASTESPTA